MVHIARPAVLGAAVLLLNIPFGYWRSGAPQFSRSWFLAVHVPVPIVIGLRLLIGVPWHVGNFLFLIATFTLGQFTGGRLRGRGQRRS